MAYALRPVSQPASLECLPFSFAGGMADAGHLLCRIRRENDALISLRDALETDLAFARDIGREPVATPGGMLTLGC